MADRLYTSQQSDEIITSLREKTKLEKYIIARIAFIYSLVKEGSNVRKSYPFTGGEMKRTSFFQSDETFIKALIFHTYKSSNYSEDEIYSNKSIIKNHIDSGSILIWELFEKNGYEVSHWYRNLLSLINLDNFSNIQTKDLELFMGRKLLDKKEVMIEINHTEKHSNCNMAIMGIPGVGKTQFLLKILTDIRIQSKYQTNIICFDYKGDIVTNDKFVELTKSKRYRLMQDNQIFPINPFILENYDEQTIRLSAREKANSFASINSKLGTVQKGALTDAILDAYAKRAKDNKPYPDFQDVYESAREIYESQKKRDDSLIEILKDLASFNIFWSHGSSELPLEKLSNKSMIIDLHKMPFSKELVAYLVIENLYKEMSFLPDSPMKDGRRVLRTILVIDEAHNYLSQKNEFLQKIIREGRSKGIVVFFASQSPNDYQQDFFDFKELLEFSFIFKCNGMSTKAVQDLLGCSKKTALELQTEIANMEPFQVISKSDIDNEEFMKFDAVKFFESYK